MKAGDLVQLDGGRCLVLRLNAQTRMASLVTQDGRKIEIPDTLDVDSPDRMQILVHPPTEWAMIAAPTKRGTGPVVRVVVPPRPRSGIRELAPWIEWIAADPVREGGPLYFSPTVGLGKGDTLIATFRSGYVARITVPMKYGTVADRKSKTVTTFEPQPERTRFNRDDLDIRGDKE